ncbi:MAG: ThuA domain-containing protein [Polyangiaceae bacterium]
MNRYSCVSLLIVVLSLGACSDNNPSSAGSAGMSSNAAGSSGASGGASGGGSSGAAGAAPGGGGAISGSGGQIQSNGGSAGNDSGGAGQPAAGASTGGSGATSGGASGGASGSSGGDGAGGSAPSLPKRVLLYDFNSTPTIPTTPQQLTYLKSQLTTWGYESVVSEQPSDISAANLATFGAVALINTCFEPFGKGQTGEAQTAALKAFVEAGGGLFGTHCASVTFQTAQPPNPYNVLLGGRAGKDNFDGKSACVTTAEAHVSTAMLPATFDFTGNIDNEDYIAPDTKVLVKCTWSGGLKKETAVSWSRTPGKGRVFYTNFAKVDSDLSDATLGQKHILLGLSWVIGR